MSIVDTDAYPFPAREPFVSRRKALQTAAHGFGWLAFSALFGSQSQGADGLPRPHFLPRAKRAVLLFMDGGQSQVDTLDPKPRLAAEHGQPFKMKIDATQFDNVGTTFSSPFKFHRHGESGIPMSEIFPHLGRVADDLCVIRSLKAEFPEHAQACYFIHSGHPLQGRPSLGAWLNYGLGTENSNLPGYVVLHGGVIPLGGVENFSSGFLPPTFQGSFFDMFSGGEIVSNITPGARTSTRDKRALLTAADADFAKSLGGAAVAVEGAIRNGETAFAMQAAVPEVADIGAESEATQKLYGLNSENKLTAQYGRQCLLARRLLERGVRFVELTCVRGIRFVAPWDDHEDIKTGHAKNAAVVDQPIAALIQDLKSRGMFEDTLLICVGEFGRTPFAQGSRGRDHNPQAMSMWLAGGGVKGGTIYGATDEYGYRAVENVVSVHDLHATILHQLGFDHERLTYRYSGRDFRLTDVYGEVVRDILS